MKHKYFKGIDYYEEEDWARKVPDGMLRISKENLQRLRHEVDSRQEETSKKRNSSDPNLYQPHTEEHRRTPGLPGISSHPNICNFSKDRSELRSMHEDQRSISQNLATTKTRKNSGRRPDLLKDMAIDFDAGFRSKRKIYLSDKPQVVAALVRKNSLTRVTSSQLQSSDSLTSETQQNWIKTFSNDLSGKWNWISRKGRKLLQQVRKKLGRTSMSIENSLAYGTELQVEGKTLKTFEKSDYLIPHINAITQAHFQSAQHEIDNNFRVFCQDPTLVIDQYISQFQMHSPDDMSENTYEVDVSNASITEGESTKGISDTSMQLVQAEQLIVPDKKDSLIETTAEVHCSITSERGLIKHLGNTLEEGRKTTLQSEGDVTENSIQLLPFLESETVDTPEETLQEEVGSLNDLAMDQNDIPGQVTASLSTASNEFEGLETTKTGLVRNHPFIDNNNGSDSFMLATGEATCSTEDELEADKAKGESSLLLPSLPVEENSEQKTHNASECQSETEIDHAPQFIFSEQNDMNIVMTEKLDYEYVSIIREVPFHHLETARLLYGSDEVDNIYLSLLDIASIEEKNSHSEVRFYYYNLFYSIH